MVDHHKQQAPAAVDREAAQWYVRWSDIGPVAGAREQSRWIAWLQRSPRHIEAYLQLDDLCERLTESRTVNELDIESWMADQRAPVVQLASTTARPNTRTDSPGSVMHRRRRALLAASIAVIGVAVAGGWSLLGSDWTHQTGLGEQRSYQLPDGSTMQLNTQSRARVAYTDSIRRIHLEGEGLFTATREAARPFVVETADATVRALGTQFNVYAQQNNTRVAVIAGAVEVAAAGRSPAAAGRTLQLQAGEEAQVSAATATRSISRTIAPDITAATAWQQGILVFERATLADVAREFNRYNSLQFDIDAAVGEVNRLSGTFDARHPQSLLLWLQNRPDLRVTCRGERCSIEAE